MIRHQQFERTELPIAAAVMAAAERQPEIFRQSIGALVIFEFPDDELTRNIVLAYVSGDLCLPIKRYEQCRSWLFRRTKEVLRQGRRHGEE